MPLTAVMLISNVPVQKVSGLIDGKFLNTLESERPAVRVSTDDERSSPEPLPVRVLHEPQLAAVTSLAYSEHLTGSKEDQTHAFCSTTSSP